MKNGFMLQIGSAVFIAILFFSIRANALSDKTEFSSLYKEYVQSVDSGKPAATLAIQAETLASLAATIFGESHDNTINLTISAANHFRDAKNNDKALRYYDKALGLYKETDNDRSLDMASLLVELLHSSNDLLGFKDHERLSRDLYVVLKDYFDEETANQEQILDSLYIFNKIVEKGALSDRMRGLRPLGKRIIEAAETRIDTTTQDLIRANFNYARLAEGSDRKNEALEYYTKVIDETEKELDFDHPFSLAAHARLVGIFESKGESEEATKHCLAIGKMKPWSDDIKPTPLYRINPDYPTKYAMQGKQGHVTIVFDISASGFVQNPRIEESDGPLFEKEAIKALEQWRYAPKFEEGEATIAKDQRVRLDFILDSDSNKKLTNS